MRLKYPTFTFLLVLLFGRAFAQPDTALSSKLAGFRAKDDLSGWIYAQIQWTAKTPAKRSGQLITAVRQAWREPHTPEEQQAWLDLLTNEGYSLLLSGAIVPSTDAYTAAYDFARKHTEMVDADVVLESVLKPLGNNYTRLGDYEQALYIHQKAETLALALDDHEALAGVYSNLANTCGNMGRPRLALDYCRKGLAVARSRSAMAGLLLSELADTYREMGKTDSAKMAIRQSIDMLTSAHDHPSAGAWLEMAYQSAGDIFEGQQALGFYQRALALQRQLALVPGEQRQRETAKLYLRLGALYGSLGRKTEADRWLTTCLKALLPEVSLMKLRVSDVYAENTLADALYVLAGLTDDPDVAIHLYELSFAADQKGRQQLITASSKERWVADVRVRYQTALDRAWGAWKRTGQQRYAYAMLRFMEGSKAQLLLDEELQQQLRPLDAVGRRIRLLEKARAYYQREMIGGGDSGAVTKLRETTWQLANLQKGHAIGSSPAFAIDSLSELLPAGVLTRSYFAGDTVLYTIECGHDGIRYVDKVAPGAGWQDSVRAFTRHWFDSGPNHMIDDPFGYYREAGGLYRRFFDRHELDSGSTYILLPDGALSLLPVDALMASNNTFVIRRAAISYGYSLETLWEQRARDGGTGFSGFFLSANRRDLPGLQAVLAERSGIEPAIRDGHWYVDSMATTAAFRAALEDASIVHISSHAFAGADSLDAPHIELYDAPFYLFDMQGFERHPSLVVLSACRTADGRFVSGEGVQSLARAFTAGGATAVVAGWWNVNDEAAAGLMSLFYAQMASQPDAPGGTINAAAALHQAKLAWLNDPGRSPLLKLPYYWAALNYQGNPIPFSSAAVSGLRPPRAREMWRLIVGALVVVLAGISGWLVKRHHPAQRRFS